MTWLARPVRTGWVVRREVPGPDVDEFAGAAEVTAALAGPGGAGDTLLAVQHPHRTPVALAAGLSLAEALPAARDTLDRLLRSAYRRVTDVVAPYLVSGEDGTAVGVLCLVDPAAVDARGLARVRGTEQVYPNVVAERAAVLSGLGCASSAAMLVPVADGARLTDTLLTVINRLGAAQVRTTDSGGRVHQLWLLGPGTDQDVVLAAAGRHALLVADGNHRVAAAMVGAPTGLLALVTAGPRLRVGALHRALVDTGLTATDLVRAWRGRGLAVHTLPASATPAPPERPGTVLVLARRDRADPERSARLLVELPPPEQGEPLPRIDHGLVERLLIAEALGIDPEGPHLRAQRNGLSADRSAADAVLLLAPVPYPDVLAVHDQGRRMPRKATYFTPKPRSGLLLASLAD